MSPIDLERCRFLPSKPPWPSQMCARCGRWRDDHGTVDLDRHADAPVTLAGFVRRAFIA